MVSYRFFYCSLCCCLLASLSLRAQAGRQLPAATHTDDWHLGVSDVQTTTLIFPHDVVTVDRGTPDVLTQTLDEITNIVKVKTAGEHMEPSSLTVITAGGMVYTFRVSYERSPATLTYRLDPVRSTDRPLSPAYRPPPPSTAPRVAPTNYSAASSRPLFGIAGGVTAVPVVRYLWASAANTAPADHSEVGSQSTVTAPPSVDGDGGPSLGTSLYGGDRAGRGAGRVGLDSLFNPMGMTYGRDVVNSEEVWVVSDRIHRAPTAPRPVARHRTSGSALELNDIWIVDDVLYYRFTLACNSNISYDIDFWRFYVVDAKQSKRTAVQERDVELIQVHSAGAKHPAHVARHSEQTFVVAVRKFTIPQKKRLVLEVFEQNGGRHHSLRLKNRAIVKARLVAPKPTNIAK